MFWEGREWPFLHVKDALGFQRLDEFALGFLHGAQCLNRLDAGDDDLQPSAFGPNVNAADDDDFAAHVDGRVHR